MAQTGSVKWVCSGGIITTDETGSVKWIITAGIPSGWTATAGGVPPFGYKYW